MTITVISPATKRGTATTEQAHERCPATHDSHFLAPSQGSVQEDIRAGATMGQLLTGPTRTKTAGKDVVIQAYSSSTGTVTVEDSADGTTWTQVASFRTGTDNPLGFRFTPGATYYRAKFQADSRGPVARVDVFSQNRT